MSELLRTALYDWHVAQNARMVDFAGWSMPVQYTSIVEEHRATREAIGLFDISHMGRLRFDGDGSAALLDRLLTRRVVGLKPGSIRYSLVANEEGGILDDVLIYQLADSDGTPFHLLVVNASNREKIVSWVEPHVAHSPDVRMTDITCNTAMLAIQGPRALAAVDPLIEASISEAKYYTGSSTQIAGHAGIASRTGYTGEDGCEVIVPSDAAMDVVSKILSAGQSHDIRPVGLGARDTLRLEAGMPLYGHELSESINPYQAGLAFAVQTKDREFIGRTRLLELKANADQLCRVGLELSGKRVPREHYPVMKGDDRVGEVTSGTFSPTLERPIAMAYVRPDVSEVGSELAVDIRGRMQPARVVELPFYQRPTS